MKYYKFLFLLITLSLTQCQKAEPRKNTDMLSRILSAVPLSRERAQEILEANKASEKLTFQQKLSHSEQTNVTFSQRYFYNGTYAKTDNSPVIFLTCGEWTCDPAAMIRMMGNRAKALGAHLVSMEHRYYGESLPGGQEATELPQLKHLKVEEALEDFATIQKRIVQDKHLTGKWIIAGCSYGGTIAAHYRARYPQLVVGAYASSAPVIATPTGFHTYDEFAANAFGETCQNESIEVTRYLHDLASTTAGLLEIKNLFGYSTEGVRQEDIDSVLVTVIPEFAQYGKEKDLCAALKKAETLREKALILIEKSRNLLGERFFSESLVGVNELKAGTQNKFGERWVYQTCAEATWHYSTSLNVSKSLFPFSLGGDYYQEACKRMYGDGIANVKSDIISKTQKIFESGSASNILFNNGSNDPWSALSYTKDLNIAKDLTALVYMGGSHCAEMAKEPLNASDPLTEIQAKTLEKMKSWLK